VALASYRLLSIEVEVCGLSSDSNALKHSIFGKLLLSNKLNFPEPRFLLVMQRGVSLPFVLVGDEGFVLSGHVLRLYHPPPPIKGFFKVRINTGCENHDGQWNKLLKCWLINGE
jgi:hypothetical protein